MLVLMSMEIKYSLITTNGMTCDIRSTRLVQTLILVVLTTVKTNRGCVASVKLLQSNMNQQL